MYSQSNFLGAILLVLASFVGGAATAVHCPWLYTKLGGHDAKLCCNPCKCAKPCPCCDACPGKCDK
jgi:hypothetical protein